jgi:methylmalonyl-CoA mutase N-terminal domain/subunit
VVTALHVYSVQPGVPKDASDLYNADYAQTEELFRRLLGSSAAEAENNPLATNLLNSVQVGG